MTTTATSKYSSGIALWARRGIKVGSMVMPSRPAPPRSSAHNDHPVAAMTPIDTSVSIVEPP